MFRLATVAFTFVKRKKLIESFQQKQTENYNKHNYYKRYSDIYKIAVILKAINIITRYNCSVQGSNSLVNTPQMLQYFALQQS